MKRNELSYKNLKSVCDPNVFKFETTNEVEPIHTGIGQERGIKALEFGLNVDVKGYNLYLEGPSGVGKTMYSKNYLDTMSFSKEGLKDQLTSQYADKYTEEEAQYAIDKVYK